MENKILKASELVERLQQEVQGIVEKLFKNLTDREIKVSSDIRTDWRGSDAYIIRGTIEFIDLEGKRDFGSDIGYDYKSLSGLEINVGTCGSYGKDNIYQVARVMLLANIWNNVANIENELSKFDVSCIAEYNRLQNELNRQRREKEETERKAKEKEIEEQIKTNQIYKNISLDRNSRYMYIKSITKKNIIIQGVYHFGTDYQYVNAKTYRINKTVFINNIIDKNYTLIQ